MGCLNKKGRLENIHAEGNHVKKMATYKPQGAGLQKKPTNAADTLNLISTLQNWKKISV